MVIIHAAQWWKPAWVLEKYTTLAVLRCGIRMDLIWRLTGRTETDVRWRQLVGRKKS